MNGFFERSSSNHTELCVLLNVSSSSYTGNTALSISSFLELSSSNYTEFCVLLNLSSSSYTALCVFILELSTILARY